eukprot:scaffold16165_cov126-Skeletonema_marinoi.AAC.6
MPAQIHCYRVYFIYAAADDTHRSRDHNVYSAIEGGSWRWMEISRVNGKLRRNSMWAVEPRNLK